MDNKLWVSYLRYFHGAYNLTVIAALFYHGIVGYGIRRNRRNDRQDFRLVKRHRKMGPFLAIAGFGGFFVGLTVVYLHEGRIMEHTVHFLNGLAIVMFLAGTFFISRKIRADAEWRTLHFSLGIAILCLSVLQALFGLGMLF